MSANTKVFAAMLIFSTAGFWAGKLSDRYYHEVTVELKIDRYNRLLKACADSCDRTRNKLAVSMYEYVEGVICHDGRDQD